MTLQRCKLLTCRGWTIVANGWTIVFFVIFRPFRKEISVATEFIWTTQGGVKTSSLHQASMTQF